MNNLFLNKKIAVVTGGARGVGRAIVEEFIKQGASVLICSRSREEVNKTCEEIDPNSKFLFGIIADISKINDCKTLIDTAVKRFGTINILVNNAAIYGPIGLLETNSSTEWKKTIEINFLGTVFCSRYATPIMKKNKSGKIINIVGGGIGGTNPLSRFSAYYSSKIALVGFTEVLAKELYDWNIQVNCVSPGAIKTQLIEYLLKQGKKNAGDEMYNQALETKKHGGDNPHLIAAMVAYLASSQSNHLTGRILSAKRETTEQLNKIKIIQKNLFTLRRIDDVLFKEVRKKY